MTVSAKLCLHDVVEARMLEVFGRPANTVTDHSHWMLSAGLEASALSAHLVLDGTADRPTLLLFDPVNRHGEEVLSKTVVTKPEDIEDALEAIKSRLKHRNKA